VNAETCTCPACRRYEQAVVSHEHALRAMHSKRNYGEHTLPATGGTSREVRRAAAQMDRHHLPDIIESPSIGPFSEAPRPSEAPRAQRTEPGIGARDDVVATANPTDTRKETDHE